jgi:hypothetical protein
VIAGVLVVVLVAAVIVAWPLVQLYTGAAPPAQFYKKVELDPALAGDYPRVLGVAHNAGNNLGTLAAGLRYGADVMEIDVVSARGQLVAAATIGRPGWPGWCSVGPRWRRRGITRRPPASSSSICSGQTAGSSTTW